MARGSTRISARNYRQKGAPAAQHAVFKTYELLEMILLALRPRDILRAAIRVDKSWHSTAASSIPINKKIISSSFTLEQLNKHPERVSAANLVHFDLFWGDVVIIKVNQEELIFVIDRSMQKTFSAQFLKGDEKIPGFSIEDYKRLNGNWAGGLADFPKHALPTAEDDFYSKFEFGLYKFIDPANGKTAEIVEQKRKENVYIWTGFRF